MIDEDAKNSSFVVEVAGINLKVVSATAKIPEQSIENNGQIELEPDSNKVVRALIEDASLQISVENHMSLSSELNLTIFNLEDINGNSFSSTIFLEGYSFNDDYTYNINNYSLIMHPDSQSILYGYVINTLDSGDELLPINSTDSVIVKFYLRINSTGTDITFSQFRGYLNQDAMVDSNTIILENNTRIDQATLNSGILKLSIENDIGIEAVVNFSLIEFTRNGLNLDTSFSLVSESRNC